MADTQIIAAVRFAVLSLMLAQATMLGYLIARLDWSRPISAQVAWVDTHRAHCIVGLLLMALGWFAHQTWWWLAEMGRARGHLALHAVLAERAIWTLLPYGLIVAGVVLFFAGWLDARFGAVWPLVGAGVVTALVTLGGINAI